MCGTVGVERTALNRFIREVDFADAAYEFPCAIMVLWNDAASIAYVSVVWTMFAGEDPTAFQIEAVEVGVAHSGSIGGVVDVFTKE